jgi:hypothetical protein
MDTVGTLAGQTITVGAVATFLAQYVKSREWFPVAYRATLVRFKVGAVCLGINAAITSLSGQLDANALIHAFFSYVVAAAAYDHLFS